MSVSDNAPSAAARAGGVVKPVAAIGPLQHQIGRRRAFAIGQPCARQKPVRPVLATACRAFGCSAAASPPSDTRLASTALQHARRSSKMPRSTAGVTRRRMEQKRLRKNMRLASSVDLPLCLQRRCLLGATGGTRTRTPEGASGFFTELRLFAAARYGAKSHRGCAFSAVFALDRSAWIATRTP